MWKAWIKKKLAKILEGSPAPTLPPPPKPSIYVFILGILSFVPFIVWAWLHPLERIDWHDGAPVFHETGLYNNLTTGWAKVLGILEYRYFIVTYTSLPYLLKKLGFSNEVVLRSHSISMVCVYLLVFIISWLLLSYKDFSLLIPLTYASQWDYFYFGMPENGATGSIYILVQLLLFEALHTKSLKKYILSALLFLLSLLWVHQQIGLQLIGVCAIFGVYFMINGHKKEALLSAIIAAIIAVIILLDINFLVYEYHTSKIRGGIKGLKIINCGIKGIFNYYIPRKILYFIVILLPILYFIIRRKKNAYILISSFLIYYVVMLFLSGTGAYYIPGLEIYAYPNNAFLLGSLYSTIILPERASFFRSRWISIYVIAIAIGFYDITKSIHAYRLKTNFIGRVAKLQKPEYSSCEVKYYLLHQNINLGKCFEGYAYMLWAQKYFPKRSIQLGADYGVLPSGVLVHWWILGYADRDGRVAWGIVPKGIPQSQAQINSLIPCAINTMQTEREEAEVVSSRITISPIEEKCIIPSRALFTVAEVKIEHALPNRLPALPNPYTKRGFTLGYQLYDEKGERLPETTPSTHLEQDLPSGATTGIYILRPKNRKAKWIQFGFVLVNGEFIPSGPKIPFEVEMGIYDYLIEWVAPIHKKFPI